MRNRLSSFAARFFGVLAVVFTCCAAGRAFAALPDGVPAPTFHVDAKDRSTMTIVTEGDVAYVERWNDASGGGMYATKSGTSGISRPWLDETEEGLPFVDFGPGKYGPSAAGTAATLNWSATDSSIREIFLVYSDYPGKSGSFLLGAKSSYQFHRGGKALFNSQYSEAKLRGGLIQVDGVTVAYSYELPEGFHIIHLRTTGGVTADRFASDRDQYQLGGQRLQEVIVYNTTISDENASKIYDYLDKKWIHTATFTVEPPTGDYVVTGAPILAKPIVKDMSENVLIETNDYTLSYENNVLPGEATVIVTGCGNHTGTVKTVFAILSSAYDIAPIPSLDCTTGFGQVPSGLVVTNRYTGVRLVEGTDYTVTAIDNDGIGTATAIATGCGTYAHQRATAPFTITASRVDDELIRVDDPSVRRTLVDGKYVYVFTNTAQTITVTAKKGVDLHSYLLVGGGGGGGNTMGGGGGGGGVSYVTNVVGAVTPAGGTFSVQIGKGGTKGGTSQEAGKNGDPTTVMFGMGTFSVIGGGGGGGWGSTAGKTGGSGGGGCNSGAGGLCTTGLGYAGAKGNGNSASGGGGGAGGPGCEAANSRAGQGGPGVTNSITGVARCYGGGGGGGGSNKDYGTYNGGFGGAGGGGNGGKGGGGSAGVPGTGGGGGGAGWTGSNQYGGTGGSGAAILVLAQQQFDIAEIPSQYVMPGGAQPTLVVRDPESGVLLSEGVDYDVSYSNNTIPGFRTAVATVTGRGAYAGKFATAAFTIYSRLYVKSDVEEEGDGASWSSPMSLTNALAQAVAATAPCAIWIAGTFSNAVAVTYAFTQPVEICGGFAGTESRASDRLVGAQSVIHAGAARTGLTFSNTQIVTIDGICFSNCTTCLTKTGAGSVTVTNCHFRTGSCGASFTGSSVATLRVMDCQFSYLDGSASWRGLNIKTFARAYVDNCHFHHIGWSTHWRGEIGPTLLCDSAPITMRHTRFAASWVHGDQSTPYGLVRILSAADECRFENCIWTGCIVDTNNRTPGSLATVYVSLATQSTPCLFLNCTMAYNKVANYTGYPGGIHIVKGAAQVRNSIFFGNVMPANNTVPGAIYVSSGASCYVTNSLFEADSVAHFMAADGGTLVVDRTSCIFGDPLFVTPLATGKSAVGTMNLGYANDLHLQSSEGYFTNDGTEHQAEGVLSPAIDAGMKGDAYGNEPKPNGGRINMGAYGNTSEASKSPAFELALTTPSVTFTTDYTQPTVSFSAGGTGIYSASAVISISTNGTEWIYTSGVLTSVTNGDSRVLMVPRYLLPSGNVWAKVTLTYNDQEIEATSVATAIAGVLPPWYAKGGPANVIHVRQGACCAKDGTSWTDAYDDLYTAMRQLSATRNEIWIAGTNRYVVTGVNPDFPSLVFRGGFDGSEDAISDRKADVVSTVDGNSMWGLSFSCTGEVLFERVDFMRCTTCIVDAPSSGGASGFIVTNCTFRSSGAGVYAVGTSAGDLIVRDCRFTDMNGSASARGVYGQSFRRTYVDDCSFDRIGATSRYRETIGPALYANATPATVRRCRFAGCWSYSNQCTPDASVAILSGTSQECAFTNCVFTGGYAYDSENRSGSTCKALIRVSLGATNAICRFERCTFAYNKCANVGWAGGLNVRKGDVYIRNSIFFGNVVHPDTTLPSDIHVLKDASCHVSYTSFGGIDAGHCAAADGGTLEIEEGSCPILDPFFVTDAATGASGLGNNAKSAAFDVHLLSPKGYWKNDGILYTDAETYSSAIDAGDPYTGPLEEPAPNGNRLNLGAYAGTAEASKTSIVKPVVDDIDITFPNGITQPRCVVRMTGENPGDVYSATVTLLCYTGAVESAGVTLSSTYLNVANGQAITNCPAWCYNPGDLFTLKVTVSANGVEPFSETKSVTVVGEISKYFGKGGGARIGHVRVGATGRGDGSDWFSAYPNLNAAFAALKVSGTSAYDELWVSETNAVPSSMEKLIVSGCLVLRGGFSGLECAASERRPGVRTVLDGGQTNELIRLENAAGRTVTFERFDIVRAYEHGLNKAGAGDLVILDCRFLNNSYTSWGIDGRGAYVAGDGTAKLVVSNCYFGGNGPLAGKRNYGYLKGSGHGIYVTSCARATFDDCVFATNGQYGVSSTASDSCAGTAIYASGTPITVRRTKFLGNRGAVRDNGSVLGGTVRLSGSGCKNSAFTNCLFVGNSAYCGWGGTAGSYGGALVLTCGSSSATTDVVNCTFAYNYVDGTTSAGGLNVYAGTANVKNCIFARNGVTGRTVSGVATRKAADIDVKASGVCNITYTLLSTNAVTSCDVASGGVLTLGAGVRYGDPLFGMTEKLSSYTADAGLSLCYRSFLKNVNVHLRNHVGYYDEVTGSRVRYHGFRSPAIDAGDPASAYANEPEVTNLGTNGRRVNLGCYGNTPYATMSPVRGAFLRVR